MEILLKALQIIIALGLLNVWLLRFNKSTAYRGGDSSSLKGEFKAYGLPEWFFIFIGISKVGSALALLAGLIFPFLILPASLLVIALMLGALAMHIRVKDPCMKSLPAFAMLLMSLALASLIFTS